MKNVGLEYGGGRNKMTVQTSLWKSCIPPSPSDILEIVIPRALQHVFEIKTGITPPHPFLIGVTNGGHFIMKWKKDRDDPNNCWMLVDSLIDNYMLNKAMGDK